MDPDVCWSRLCYLSTQIQKRGESMSYAVESAEDAEEMAELTLALDEWMKNGGFPPQVFERRKGR